MVVLVHGSLDSSRSFGRVARRLRDVHTVVYDRRGYQRSRQALPLNTTIAGQADDLLAVIDGRPSVVVGHSYGGAVALAAALRGGPSPIRSLVAFEPPLPWVENQLGLPDRAEAGQRWKLTDPDDPDQAGDEAEGFFRRMVGDSSWERLTDEGKAGRRADGPALVTELAAVWQLQPLFDVGAMRIPVIYGRGSRTIERRRLAVEWLVEHTPGAVEAVIEGADHGAHLTHPDAFADLARLALARVGSFTEVSQ